MPLLPPAPQGPVRLLLFRVCPMSAEDGRGLHRVTWLIDNASEPRAKFSCLAEPGSLCRSWCVEGCDEWCSDERGHAWEDTGECRVLTFLENTGTAGELYMGDDDEPVRSGPIETEWTGDLYLWQYADVEVAR